MIRWERTLKALFDEIDDWLEERYGEHYRLHPNRPRRGGTANKEMDGLFNVGADFTPGYGSRLGRGYIVQIQLSTLDRVEAPWRGKVEADVVRLLKEKLPQRFPGRDLQVKKDGNLLKIIGDFSLGAADIH